MKNGYEASITRDASNFASFLANLAVPEEEPLRIPEPDRWDCDELADDVATIRWEGAAVEERSARAGQTAVLAQASESGNATPASVSGMKSCSQAAGRMQGKSASVTIRMTRAECAQLHERSAAAGMTVSAYLRLCIFEAETLRAQVKEALAQFNAAAERPQARPVTKDAGGDVRGSQAQSGRRGFGPRIFSRWAAHRSAARG
jgi:hypothetical protein